MLRTFFGVLAAAGLASAAWAQCSGGEAKATASCNKTGEAKAACMTGDKAGCSKGQTAGSGCCMSKTSALAAKSIESIPTIKYVVGDKTTCCSQEAAILAEAEESKIQYLVGEQKFAEMPKAQEAYAELLNAKLAEFTTVKYAVGDEATDCPMTAKSLAEKNHKPVAYRLAAYDFKTEDAAAKAAKAANEAAGQVKLAMKVGDKDFCCSTMAGAESKTSGKPVEYIVGDKKSCCPTESAVNVARAKLEAAIRAIDAAYAAGDSVASAG